MCVFEEWAPLLVACHQWHHRYQRTEYVPHVCCNMLGDSGLLFFPPALLPNQKSAVERNGADYTTAIEFAIASLFFSFFFQKKETSPSARPKVLHPALSAGCGDPASVSSPSGSDLEGAGAAEFTPGAFRLSWLVYTAHRAPVGRQVLNLLTSRRDKQTVEFAIPPSK